MNTLELLKASRTKQTKNAINSLTPVQSRLKDKKPPQSRLSYLKKLFSKNIVLETDSQKMQSEDQMRAFAKSGITVNSIKNLGKIHFRQLSNSSHIHSTNKKRLSRFNSIHENDFLLQNKYKICPKSTHLKINPGPYITGPDKLITKTKFVQRHRKIPSEGYQVDLIQKNSIQSTCQSPRELNDLNGYAYNHSFIEPKNKNLIKKEIRQLRKIGRMLDDIKCEILKNRSVLIEGMKEIKQIQSIKSKGHKSIKITKQGDYLKQLVQDFEQLRENKFCYKDVQQLGEKKERGWRNSDDSRPKVQYKNILRMI